MVNTFEIVRNNLYLLVKGNMKLIVAVFYLWN